MTKTLPRLMPGNPRRLALRILGKGYFIFCLVAFAMVVGPKEGKKALQDVNDDALGSLRSSAQWAQPFVALFWLLILTGAVWVIIRLALDPVLKATKDLERLVRRAKKAVTGDGRRQGRKTPPQRNSARAAKRGHAGP